MAPEKLEILVSMDGWVEENILPLLRPVETSWQPQDFLPEASAEGFFDDPDEFYVCLVGDMVTGSAADVPPRAWAVWTRAWTAEENRHGDLLNRYLYLCGRLTCVLPVDNNPYMGFVYTSFQERATFISHGNTARHAKKHGDLTLAKICGTIAADEKRHEMAYSRIVAKLFELDPDASMQAFAAMMRKRVNMPAQLMFDGEDPKLFDNYAAVAQRTGVYTAKDYADIVEFLVKEWKVEHVTGLSGEGRAAQEYLCSLGPRIRKVEERAQERAKQASMVPFSWIFNKGVLA
ncbi:unnamed protein product [Spirodela intermedia]|uniref:Uncharacterized protein n=1 Tax=Spirodela intermedia TaxID=51605 RepID=A0A7I8JJ03_SPIIN|nr:unnamed protein product [Spirodela intermedia]CAA6669503.1 unnamed protein product [Spirodela intermedia]